MYERLIIPRRDSNPSQVSSQQTLVLIYLSEGWKAELSSAKRRPHKCLNLDRAGNQTCNLVVVRLRSYQLCYKQVVQKLVNFNPGVYEILLGVSRTKLVRTKLTAQILLCKVETITWLKIQPWVSANRL